MIVRNGPTMGELSTLVEYVSNTHYSGNLGIKDIANQTNSRAIITRFTLRVADSRGAGAHQSASWVRNRDGSRHRTVAACWHTHRDVLRAIFTRYPHAVVRSAFATYDGLEGFNRTFPATYDRIVGAAIEPVCYGDLCECDDADDMSEHTLGVGAFTPPTITHDEIREGHHYRPTDPHYQACEDEMLSWREFVESLKVDK